MKHVLLTGYKIAKLWLKQNMDSATEDDWRMLGRAIQLEYMTTAELCEMLSEPLFCRQKDIEAMISNRSTGSGIFDRHTKFECVTLHDMSMSPKEKCMGIATLKTSDMMCVNIRNNILFVDSMGGKLHQIQGEVPFRDAMCMCVHPSKGHVFVLENHWMHSASMTGMSDILAFDTDGRLLYKFPLVNAALYMDIDKDGFIYTYASHGINKYDGDTGQHVKIFSGTGDLYSTNIAYPLSMKVLPNGNIILVCVEEASMNAYLEILNITDPRAPRRKTLTLPSFVGRRCR